MTTGTGTGRALANVMPAKSETHEKKKSAEMTKHRKQQGGNPCKPGYEPVPGKKPGAQGSCRKKGG